MNELTQRQVKRTVQLRYLDDVPSIPSDVPETSRVVTVRPQSATFHRHENIGLDVIVHVKENLVKMLNCY